MTSLTVRKLCDSKGLKLNGLGYEIEIQSIFTLRHQREKRKIPFSALRMRKAAGVVPRKAL